MEYGVIPEGASRHYISGFSMYLSDPYELADGDQIKGEIITVRKPALLPNTFEEIKELQGEDITFILSKRIIIDRLYIAKNVWEEKFREHGLVVGGYEIQSKLTYAIRQSTKVELYTKADLAF
jgi:hypothetical protein